MDPKIINSVNVYILTYIVVALNAWYMVQIMILKLMLKFRNVTFYQNNDISVCLAVCYHALCCLWWQSCNWISDQ